MQNYHRLLLALRGRVFARPGIIIININRKLCPKSTRSRALPVPSRSTPNVPSKQLQQHVSNSNRVERNSMNSPKCILATVRLFLRTPPAKVSVADECMDALINTLVVRRHSSSDCLSFVPPFVDQHTHVVPVHSRRLRANVHASPTDAHAITHERKP